MKTFCSGFSVDVEDGVSIAMRDVFGRVVPQTDRVVQNTERILEILDKHRTQATFFTLGQVAEAFPHLVKKIAREGHEIAVHGYNHLLFHQLTPRKAHEELSTAKKRLEDISGYKVVGHRAPAFSISPKTSWAFDVIADCGFTYDSSIMPIRSRRYGWADFPQDVTIVQTSSGNKLIEVPISVTSVFGRKVPFSGGSYLRLFPFLFVRKAYRSTIKERPAILYIHPYELDYFRYPKSYFKEMNKQPLLTQLKMRSNWLGRKRLAHRLDSLLSEFQFGRMDDIIRATEIKSHVRTSNE